MTMAVRRFARAAGNRCDLNEKHQTSAMRCCLLRRDPIFSAQQNLKIKTFVGSSSNAVRTQIWTALIALRLIKILQLRLSFAWVISNLTALLRWNLFTYRDLWRWINRPFDTAPESPPIQPDLFDLDSSLFLEVLHQMVQTSFLLISDTTSRPILKTQNLSDNPSRLGFIFGRMHLLAGSQRTTLDMA